LASADDASIAPSGTASNTFESGRLTFEPEGDEDGGEAMRCGSLRRQHGPSRSMVRKEGRPAKSREQ